MDACNSGDVDALMATMTEDVRYLTSDKPPRENLNQVNLDEGRVF